MKPLYITMRQHGILTTLLFLLTFATTAQAGESLWREVATELTMPYGVLLVNDETYVSTVPDIVTVDEKTGDVTTVKTLTEASPSGMLLDEDRSIVAVENGTGSLLRFDQDFNLTEVIAQGLGDPVTVKRQGKAYYVSDYNFGTGEGRLLRVDRSSHPKVYAQLSAPGGFHVDEDGIVISEFDTGQLVALTHRGHHKQVIAEGLGRPLDVIALERGYLVTDFGGFDGTQGRLLHVGSNGRVTVLDDSELGNPAGLKIHGGALYVTDLIGGRLLKANLYQLFSQTEW
jgi:hypothetical protein